MSEIMERVRSIAAENLNLAGWVIKPDTTLSKLGMDSLDAIGLIMAVERELGCYLPQDVFNSIDNEDGDWTFGAFANAVEKSICSRSAGQKAAVI